MPACFVALATIRRACEGSSPLPFRPGKRWVLSGASPPQGAENAPGGWRDADGSSLAALAEDGDEHGPIGSVGAVGPAQRNQLGDAEAACVGEPEEGVISSFGAAATIMDSPRGYHCASGATFLTEAHSLMLST
jgi:hypothetical protein